MPLKIQFGQKVKNTTLWEYNNARKLKLRKYKKAEIILQPNPTQDKQQPGERETGVESVSLQRL